MNADDVHGKGRGKTVAGEAGQRADGRNHTRIVHQNVQTARLGGHAGNRGIDIGLPGDIQLQDRRRIRQGFGLAKNTRKDARALRHQHPHQFGTDAARGPGYKHGSARKVGNGNGGEVEHFC